MNILNNLTVRQVEIIQYIIEGKSTTAIAAILGVKRSTIINHLNNAQQRLGARNKTQVVMIFKDEVDKIL